MEGKPNKVTGFVFSPPWRATIEVFDKSYCDIPGIEYATVRVGKRTRTWAHVSKETPREIVNKLWPQQWQKTNYKGKNDTRML